MWKNNKYYTYNARASASVTQKWYRINGSISIYNSMHNFVRYSLIIFTQTEGMYFFHKYSVLGSTKT